MACADAANAANAALAVLLLPSLSFCCADAANAAPAAAAVPVAALAPRPPVLCESRYDKDGSGGPIESFSSPTKTYAIRTLLVIVHGIHFVMRCVANSYSS